MYDSFKRKNEISLQDFNLAARVFFALVAKSLIEGPLAVRLPRRMGVLMIRKNRLNKKLMDFPHYKRTGEVRLLKNDPSNSGGWMATYYWDKSIKYCDTTRKSGVMFTPTRGNKVKLTRAIKFNNMLNKYWS